MQFRAILVPMHRHRVLGGGSSINGQAMQRGFPEDFDSWATLGNDEWSYDKVVPYFRKSERDLDIHDVAVESTGRVVFVNTRFGCLATLSERDSFTPLWRPPFLSKLVAEDRCHLNGLAIVDDRPRYVTALGETVRMRVQVERLTRAGAVPAVDPRPQCVTAREQRAVSRRKLLADGGQPRPERIRCDPGPGGRCLGNESDQNGVNLQTVGIDTLHDGFSRGKLR